MLLQFAFEVMDLHRITADVDPRNTASIRVLERLGFKREGYFRENYLLYGELQDAVMYGLLRSELPWSSRNTHVNADVGPALSLRRKLPSQEL